VKKKIFLLLFFSFFIIIILSTLLVNRLFQNIKYNLSQKYYFETLQQYHLFLNKESTFLKSISEYLAKSPITIKAYKENKKQYLINAFFPLYKILKKNGLINEMHFFKTPVINFVAFSNLKAKEINLTKARKDILWITTSMKPSVHFYVCRHYPGLRATYPIISNYHIYGSISLGSDLIKFRNLFKELNMSATIYLNDKILKKSLDKENYLFYAKYPLYNGYRVIGTLYKINFHNKYEIKNTSVYTVIPIKDLFKRKIAYIIVKRNFANVINILKNTAFKKLFFDIVAYLIVFIIFYGLFRYIYNRFEDLQKVLELIKEKKFDKLPKKVKEKDEFDKCKNNLIDVAKHLSLYINLLTNEMNYYSKKAYVDELTSIYNRNFLEEKAEEITTKFKLSKKPFGVIMFDIDNFKQINDTYGHDIGDLVLREIAQNIKNLLRKEDIFIRYGGEEFIILLPNSIFKDTIKIAEKIRKETENLKIEIPNKILKVTISLGVSEFSQNDNTIFDAIKRADIKLYKAKKSGKNRVCY